MRIEEGYIDFHGFKTWYRKVGECEKGKYPLLVLHGGPGSCHNYLTSLDALEKEGRQVIYYDQLGCGNSSVPDGTVDWNENLFLQELENVRNYLGLSKVHILGQSWGGMLGMQYMQQQPDGVLSLVVSSSPASMKVWQEEAKELIQLLPPADKTAILESEKSNDYENKAYKDANEEYTRRHVCSLDPWPKQVAVSMNSHVECYEKMIGPSEFTITGTLKDWDITKDLDKITVPVLLTSGTMDEATPYMMKCICVKIPHCRWLLLKGTHLVHWEQQELYNHAVEEFLKETERSESTWENL